VIFDTDEMSEKTMLAVAREMNLSETAFVRQSEAADFGVRFFTPAEEIPLAGHPTIATVHALVEIGLLLASTPLTHATLELIVGIISVEIYTSCGIVQRIVMEQQKPQFLATYQPERVMPVFGLEAGDALPNTPIQTVSTGTPQLMAPLRSLDALRRARVNFEAYDKFRDESDFFSPHLFCLQGVTPRGRVYARHFGSPPDLMEDPFTGSATGGMGAYLWYYGLIDEPTFIAEQGHWMGRPGEAAVEVIGPRDEIETVKVGGCAVTVMDGELTI